MATDVFGNEVGNYAVIDATEAVITIAKGGSDDPGGTSAEGFVLGANVTYNVPVNPVITFGKDVVMAIGHPQGSFSFTHLAGSTAFADLVKNTKCETQEIDLTFGVNGCDISTTIPKFGDAFGQDRHVSCMNATWTQFSIQGQASDSFFSLNCGGVFHYLGATSVAQMPKPKEGGEGGATPPPAGA